MKKSTRRVGLPKQLGRIQAEAEKAINRGYRATLELLPERPRKVVKELTSQIEAGANDLAKRSEKAFKTVEKRGNELVGRVEKAVRTLERRSGRVLTTVETQGAKLISTIEHRAAQVVRPLVRRLDIATLSDIERLSRRLAQLERRRTVGVKRAA